MDVYFHRIMSYVMGLCLTDDITNKLIFDTIKATYFLSTGSSAFISRFIVVYYASIGFNPIQIGILTVGGKIMKFIGSMFWGYTADRSKNIRFLFVISFLGGIGTVITIPLLDSFWYQLALTVVTCLIFPVGHVIHY